ncbi:MAG: hypothetical protein KGH69_03015 [Candidatus Micrarchaeota archaeon]|nr:hypothetical protein [Candidatus Micrarchaeota archaeon]
MVKVTHRTSKKIGAKEWKAVSVALGIMLVFAVSYIIGTSFPLLSDSSAVSTTAVGTGAAQNSTLTAAERDAVPAGDVVLQTRWGASIERLVASNALNVSFLNRTLSGNGHPLTVVEKGILNGTYEGNITMNRSDAMFTLLVLWALGINNNNTIINNGPVTHSGDPYAFASTGGYGQLGVLQLGNLNIVNLSGSQQLVANYTAQNSYRPCCNNPTFFPDCNHGAAALGLIELMASQGASEQSIFSALENFNSIQFPQQYTYLAAYSEMHGAEWKSVDPSIAMSYNYSSAAGAASALQYLRENGLAPAAGGTSC